MKNISRCVCVCVYSIIAFTPLIPWSVRRKMLLSYLKTVVRINYKKIPVKPSGRSTANRVFRVLCFFVSFVFQFTQSTVV